MIGRKLVLGITLLLIGFILLSIPIYDGWKQSRDSQALEEALELIKEQGELMETNYESSSNRKLEKQIDSTFSNEELRNVIELEIPSIDLKEKVLTETNELNLSIALTQLKPNQVVGKGNFAIAGHRGYLNEDYFLNLPEVKKDDEIFLHAQGNKYVYKVKEINEIEPTEVEVVSDREGKKEVTLITCTTDGRNRIAVTGELAYIAEVKEEEDS
ncbi:class D sortase [Ornithinibacillus scapharcae]|uniref:class D sortase n=1 Tax=Ornithinibacillus scapharcae TaxID=1147159 RepID=UPI000225BD49|nr:class D sortase [Ornithinibacillus scapharcae]